MREYPAYGRTLATHIVRGQKPIAIAVLLSSRWGYFDHVPKVCIQPDEWALGRYEFSFLRGLHVVVVPGDDAGDLQLAELLVDLMRAGPAWLWAFNADGTKIYDDEWPDDVSRWARELAVRAGAGERLPWSTVRAAELVMREAKRRALATWQIEADRIAARGDIEAYTAWLARENTTKDRVRELFSSPDAPGARAA